MTTNDFKKKSSEANHYSLFIKCTLNSLSNQIGIYYYKIYLGSLSLVYNLSNNKKHYIQLILMEWQRCKENLLQIDEKYIKLNNIT